MEPDSKRIVAEWNREIAAEDHRLAAARQALPCLPAIYGFRAASSPPSLSKGSISPRAGSLDRVRRQVGYGGCRKRAPATFRCAILSFR